MTYITAETVTNSLGADWHGGGDINLSLKLANAWLKARRLPKFENVPDDVLLAGALVAREIAHGKIYNGSDGTIKRKKVKAGSVESEKEYADNSVAISAGEQQALALLAQYQTTIPSVGFVSIKRKL